MELCFKKAYLNEKYAKIFEENRDFLEKEILRLSKIAILDKYYTPFCHKIFLDTTTFEIKIIEVPDIRVEYEGHICLFTANGYIKNRGFFKYDENSLLSREEQVDIFFKDIKCELNEDIRFSLTI